MGYLAGASAPGCGSTWNSGGSLPFHVKHGARTPCDPDSCWKAELVGIRPKPPVACCRARVPRGTDRGERVVPRGTSVNVRAASADGPDPVCCRAPQEGAPALAPAARRASLCVPRGTRWSSRVSPFHVEQRPRTVVRVVTPFAASDAWSAWSAWSPGALTTDVAVPRGTRTRRDHRVHTRPATWWTPVTSTWTRQHGRRTSSWLLSCGAL